MDDENRHIKRALLSVSDKSGLTELGQFLENFGVEILSTGGSAKALRDAGIGVKEISSYTGFPEMMDGRVKTLHPKVHGGLLALREEAAHREAMAEHGIDTIDLLVVNLSPFFENIDIGGPAMIRSASKNHGAVTVVVEVADYEPLIENIKKNNGATSPVLRRELAVKAFTHTASYDLAVAVWMASHD